MQGNHHYLTTILVLLVFTVGCQSSRVKTKQAEAAATTPVDLLEAKPVAAETAGPAEKATIAAKQGDEEAANDLQLKLVGKNGKPLPFSKTPTVHDGKEITKVQVSGDSETQSSLLAATSAAAEKTAAIANRSEEILSSRRAGKVSAEKALSWLKNGNRRYTKGFFRGDGASAKDRARLIAGQTPHSTVFSCSDSRVPPEIVLDQKLGEIYVVRVSGKVLNANTISSLEYAVQYLGTNLVVLLGHDNCNASDERVQTAILAESKILRDAVSTGNVKISSALYHLDSGVIDWK